MAKKARRINLEYRPKSYWDRPASKIEDLAWQVVHDMVDEYRATGEYWLHVAESLCEEEIEERVNTVWQKLHWTGNDYMPPYAFGEVPIASVVYDKTIHTDVVEIRAQCFPNGIAYRIVDDCEGEYPGLRDSEEPLTLGELIQLIDSADFRTEYSGLVLGPARLGLGPRVYSEFYPKLEDWYAPLIEEEEAGDEEASDEEEDADMAR